MKKITYPFEWLDEDGLMVVHVEINGESTLPFLLDTGSSDTYLDKNILHIEQINLKEANYSGVLGMDILRQKNLCLHFDKNILTFS